MAKARNNGTGVLDTEQATASQAARDQRRVYEKPYAADVTVEGVAHLILHRYDCSEVEAKGAAAKGSKTKKTDNVESYVYRIPETGEIGVPGVNIKSALLEAAKSIQDPRSPRKSARDLFKASIFVTPEIPSLGKKEWDFLDRRGALIQRARITRVRPGFHSGWRLSFTINVIQPAYVTPQILEQALGFAGAFVGLCDMRPDYGRFAVRSFEIRDEVGTR